MLVDLTNDHLRRIKVREMERLDMGDNFLRTNASVYMESEYKRALIDDEGEIVLVCGSKNYGSGAWVWILASDLIYKNPVASLEQILRAQAEGLKKFPDLKYLFTFNDPSFPFAIKFLERIGFEQKMVTNAFNDGKDRILLVKEIK